MGEPSPSSEKWILWLRRLLIAWLLTPLLILLLSFLAVIVFPLFIIPIGLVYIFWPAFLSRAAVDLVPRRAYVFAVLPVLILITILIAYTTMAIVFVVAGTASRLSLPNMLLDAASPALLTGIFLGAFSTAIWLFTPRYPPTPRFYRCVKCNYQLQGSLHAPRCPECGHVLELGLDYPYLPKHLEALKNLQQPAAEDDEA